jgi:signal recognition particle GTPase
MMSEIENIKKAINPHETLFIVDAMTGQDAVNTAKSFNDRLLARRRNRHCMPGLLSSVSL